jgi:Cu/Ag efflux protein CusF
MTKRLFGVMIGLLVVLAFSGFVFAQATSQPAKPEAAKPEAMKPAETKAEPAKAPEMKKAAPPKPVMYRAGGKVVAVDLKANKITIDQKAVKRERKLALRVGKKAAMQLAGIRVGDVVNVWVTDGTVTKLIRAY